MAHPHLIVLDLDGTLLKKDKTISKYTKNVLNQAMKEGHQVCIATGRPYRLSKMYYQELGLRSPIVNFNGALSHHPNDPTFEKKHESIPLDQAYQIIKTCYSLEIKDILIEVEDQIYRTQSASSNNNFFTQEANSIQTGELLELLQDHPTGMLLQFQPHQDWEQIETTFANRHSHIVHHRKWMNPFNVIEVLRQGVNKANGVERIAHYYQIPQDRIIAFGDEDNDMELLQYAGKGIAMGNAIEPLKQVANDITLDNEKDGVGTYLQSYLKLFV